MPTRKSKKSNDVNVTAFHGVQSWVESVADPESVEPPKEKNPAAVARGAKSGMVRAEKLPAKKRKAIAKKAAKARWGNTGKA